MITDDIIKLIDKIYNIDTSKPYYEYDLKDPIAGIVTPEWYYSDSYKIFSNQTINWEEIEKSDLTKKLVKRIINVDIMSKITGEFEVDFFCWYQSYHFLPRTNWGIHITQKAWLNMASKLYTECPSLMSKPLESVKAAFLYLYYHSLYHYLIENAVSILEIILNQKDVYIKYFSNVYSQEFNSAKCIEESLANRYLLKRWSEHSLNKEFLIQILSNQGEGYKQFIKYLGKEFFNGNRLLINRILQAKIDHYDQNQINLLPLEQLIDIFNPITPDTNHNIPIWLHEKPIPLR
jgi:hypothetical protein